MKLGIFMLVLGLLIAATGAGVWFFNEPSFLGYRSREAQGLMSFGLAGGIFGAGLAIGGIIRMLVSRR